MGIEDIELKIHYLDCSDLNNPQFKEINEGDNVTIYYAGNEGESEDKIIRIENFTNTLLDDIIRYVPIKIILSDGTTDEQYELGEDYELWVGLNENITKKGIGLFLLKKLIDTCPDGDNKFEQIVFNNENPCQYLPNISKNNNTIKDFENHLKELISLTQSEKPFVYSKDIEGSFIKYPNPKVNYPYYTFIKLSILNNAFFTQSGSFEDLLTIKLVKKQ